jgi:DNA-directed RNA polymerase I subunit RPA2
MSGGAQRKPTFDTLAREQSFKHPPKTASTFPILDEFVKPHLESFNALFDDSGLPVGDENGLGLLSLAIKDIGERVVFDGKGRVGPESGEGSWGNRMSGEWMESVRRYHAS